MSIRPLIGEGRVRESGAATTSPLTASWRDGAVVFDHRHWVCDEAELTWTAPSHLIVLTQKGRTSRTRIKCSGGLVHDARDRPGALSFIPAGIERSGQYRDVDLVYSALWIDPRLSCLDGLGPNRLPVLVNGSDAVVSALLSSLQQELASGCKPGMTYIEHVIALAIHRIAVLDGARPVADKHARLSRTVVSRVEDHIEAHLGQDISLNDLAEIAGMASDSFARRFKATTGLAPYAFVIERRVRRAEILLARSEMALAALAMSLGFSSHSHFTTTFRRLRGTTPHAYRQRFFPEFCNGNRFSESRQVQGFPSRLDAAKESTA